VNLKLSNISEKIIRSRYSEIIISRNSQFFQRLANQNTNMNSFKQEILSILESFLQSISDDLNIIASQKLKLALPFIPPSFLKSFLKEMTSIFQQETSLLEFDGKVVIIGDIQGHYLDLSRIMKTFQLPVHHKYLFLGNLVGKCGSSFEAIFIIFVLKYLYPDSVYIIRGNHEFQSFCSSCVFLSEIRQKYQDAQIFMDFMEVFSYFPFAAIIQNKYLCIHGGLSQDFTSVDQIRSIQKPISDYNEYSFLPGML
jgi:protein phosphatase